MTESDTLKIEGFGFTPMEQYPMRLFLPLGPIHL